MCSSDLGYCYGNSNAVHENPRESKGRPGTRAPHVWVNEKEQISTLDWYGRNVVLVTGPDGAGWVKAADAASGAFGIQVETRTTTACEEHGITTSGVLLVRPDGFVAWREPGESDDADAALAAALRDLLRR